MTHPTCLSPVRPTRCALLVTAFAAVLTACGGGGGGGGGAAPPTGGTCSATARKQWVVDVMREWYLYPTLLPATLDISQYATPQEVIDALTATARSQGRDRNFSYLTSIAQENAFFSSGASAGFGIRLRTDAVNQRLYITEAFEGAPALAAGLDRGDEITAIGETAGTLRSVAAIFQAEGSAGITNAIGPSTAGVTRALQVVNAAGSRVVTVTKQDYSLTPVSSRYGARIIDDGGRQVGYLNLRTFISSADPRLREEFARFRAQGIGDFILDFRYNGGGLVSTAELLGDLLGRNRSSGQIFNQLTFRPEKSSQNSIKYFATQPEAVAPVRLAFITTSASASASELVINAFVPYFSASLGLIGGNSFGKPVGQIAFDQSACDDRLRVVAFTSRNAAGTDNYFTGLASVVDASCAAPDDISRPLGDPAEGSTRQALDFLAGRACTPITAALAPGPAKTSTEAGYELLLPDQPTPAQRLSPGSF